MIPLAGGTAETIFSIVGTGSLGIVITLATKLYFDNRRLSLDKRELERRINADSRQERADERQERSDDARVALDLEAHRDSLTFELLQAAQNEIKLLRADVERHRFNEDHIRHFETALEHIEALLLVETAADRKAAERQARAFLNRMRRMQEVRGVVRNELQRIESAHNLDDGPGPDDGRQGGNGHD